MARAVVYVRMYLFDFEFRLEYVSSDHTWARACIYYTGISLLDKNRISIQRRLNNAHFPPCVDDRKVRGVREPSRVRGVRT